MKYEDIIHLPHHRSKKHAPMPLCDRAAQFSPFAALTGHNEAIEETARFTNKKIELDEYEIAALDEKLQEIKVQITDYPEVTVTYFQQDLRKDGGEYVTLTGAVKKIDEYKKCLVFQDGLTVFVENILKIEIKKESMLCFERQQ